MSNGSARVGAIGHTIFYADATIGNRNAGFHNSIYRGKHLGNSLTAEQSQAIQNGTFDDLFVGDYWTIGGVNWRIAHFDPYYRCGSSDLQTHHIAVVPDASLYSTKWNETNDTSTGYVGSAIRANIKAASATAAGAEAKVIAAFGDSHVLSYKNYYPSAYSGQLATAWADQSCRVELMSEVEVYGCQVWGGTGYEVGESKTQLALFRLNPQMVNIRAGWWLRTVSTGAAGYAALVASDGCAYSNGASYSRGVRPLSLIA